jgi:metallo-beta-lactamase class B
MNVHTREDHMISSTVSTYQQTCRSMMILALSALSCGVAYAAPAPDGAKSDTMYEHIMKARKAAGTDLMHQFYHRCFVDPNYTDTIAKLRKAPAPMEPLKVFDQLYFLGQNDVSSWALQTSDGIILFDTHNNPADAKQYIEGGMAKLGLDPKQIKYVFIMHEHADHFGGAKYLKEKYPSLHLVASATAWAKMPTANRADGLVPAHDMDIADGQVFKLGDTTLTWYLTPGHSDGTISTIFKVTDHGTPHVVGFFGGLGSPNSAVNRNKIIASFQRWKPIAAAAGVDTLIANHQGQDYSVENLEFLKVRHATDPNPYVIGKDAYQRYFDVQIECTYANLIRKE